MCRVVAGSGIVRTKTHAELAVQIGRSRFMTCILTWEMKNESLADESSGMIQGAGDHVRHGTKKILIIIHS